VPPEDDSIYFGSRGERMNMILNFFVNQHIFYALATSHTKPLKEALTATANNPVNTAWGQFLRNHDE
jgi:maltose alpha-D-glucosyltransferase/alpha-amylase